MKKKMFYGFIFFIIVFFVFLVAFLVVAGTPVVTKDVMDRLDGSPLGKRIRRILSSAGISLLGFAALPLIILSLKISVEIMILSSLYIWNLISVILL